MMGLGQPQLHGKFEVASFSHCRKGHTHFFVWWDLMMGLGKLQLHAKFEVADFIYFGNIRKFVFK